MTNSRQREKLICWFGVYVFGNQALIPKCISTNEGDFDVEPIQEIILDDPAELIAALDKAIEMGNPEGEVPEYSRMQGRTPMEKLIGARSWVDLERKTIYFSIEILPTAFKIESWGRAPDGKWGAENEPVLDVRIPMENGATRIADVILEHLKTRTDLSGSQA